MEVTTTNTPAQAIEPLSYTISEERWSDLEVMHQQGLDTARAQTDNLSESIDYWNDMLEMAVAQRDEPWPNASSLCVPIVAMMKESVLSKLVAAVFVPRLYVISPLSEQSTQGAPKVENFFNAEFRRRKWLRSHIDAVDLSLNHGAGFVEVLWEKREIKRKVKIKESTGQTDPNTGEPEKQTVIKEMTIMDHNGPKLDAVEWRDLRFLPTTARNPNEAVAVYRRLYLSEAQLWEMTRGDAATLVSEKVQYMLDYYTTGDDDHTRDPEGTATYEEAGAVSVGDMGSHSPTNAKGEDIRDKGLFEVWRIHRKDVALRAGKEPEETVFYYNDFSRTQLGAAPYAYWHGRRPFVKFAPMPRVNRMRGWGVPERLRGYQEEANATHNQRKDAMDLKICPPTYKMAGVALLTKDNAWGPKAQYEVPMGQEKAIGIIDIGDIPMSSWQEEALIYRYAAAMVGLEAPTMPIMGNQKIPMKQQQAFQTTSNVRMDLMALEIRLSCEEVLWQIKQLYLQYGDDDMENELGSEGIATVLRTETGGVATLTVSYEDLAQDYNYGVAGTEGALDQDTERSQAIQLYAMLMQSPLVQPHLDRVWELTSYVLEKWNLASFARFIGTKEDAGQQQQAQQEAAKKQHDEEMALQLASHSKNPSPQGGNGKPPASNLQPPGGGQQVGGTPSQPGAPQ